MGGEITVRSKLNSGSTFSFDCHFKKQKDAQANQFTKLSEKPLKALIVDDNDFSRNILKNYLSSFSIHVDLVKSGMDAINKLSEDPDYDFILMDYNMPGLNGIMTTERIRMLFEKANLPSVLMVTAYGNDEVYKNACLAGVDSFLTKPVNQSLLYDSLVELLDTDNSIPRLSKPVDNDAVAASLAGARLLVVEDNRINQQVAQGLLEDVGFEIVIANHGLDAIEMLNDDNDFDAILMDVQMPVMDGREATKRIRHMSKPMCDIPIIALTAHALSAEKQKCLDAGMDGHVSKPIQMEDLLVELEKLVKVKPGRAEKQKAAKDAKNNGFPYELDGLDVTAGLAMVGGKQELFRSLLVDLYIDYVDFNAKLDEAIEKSDLEFVERYAHTLKGIGGTIGAAKLMSLSADVERKLMNGEVLDELTLQQFKDEMSRVLKSISVLQPDKSNEMDNDVKSNGLEIIPKIKELKKYFESGDIRATDTFVQLSPYIKKYMTQEDFTQLKKYIEAYEYDEALVLIKKMSLSKL
jgi:CheY-like chemotaxis protein